MKNRLLFSLLSIFLVSLLFSPSVFSQDTQGPVVRVAPYALPKDNLYVVDIVIENGQNVAGYQVILQYDSNSLEYQKIEHGDYLPKGAFFGEPKIIDTDQTNSLKAVRFAATSYTSESNGYGILATLIFKKSGETDLTLLDGPDGTLLSNKDGVVSYPHLGHSKTNSPWRRDLVIGSVQAISADTNEERYHYDKEEQFQLRATVINIGNLPTVVTQLKFYAPSSTPHEIETPLEIVPINPVKTVEPNSTIEVSLSDITLNAFDPGIYYYKVCVETYSKTAEGEDYETDANNNCSDPIKIKIGLPDLKITDIRVESRNVESGKEFTHYEALRLENPGSPTGTTVGTGQQFILYTTLANIGSVKSDATTVGYYFSVDNILSEDEKFRTVDQEPLNPNSEPIWRWFRRITAPENPGTYYYGFCIDSVEGEINTDNNCKIIKVTVERPDLKIIDIRVESDTDTAKEKGEFLHYYDLKKKIENPGPATVEPGQQFLLYATLTNAGLGKSEETKIRCYFSINDTISETDEVLAIGIQKPIDPSRESSWYLPITAPENPDIYYYGFCVDSVEGEANTDNNCKIIKVTVRRGNPSGLEPPQNLITDVAFGKDVTYFVLNPQVERSEGKKGYYYEQTTITLHIPGTKYYNRDNITLLEELLDILPEKIPYFMIPLEKPSTRVEDLEEAIADTEIDAKGTIFNGIWLAITLFPIDKIWKAGKTLKNTIDAFNTILGAASDLGETVKLTTDLKNLSETQRDIIEAFLQTYEPPKVTIYGDVVEDDISRILFMIPKQLQSIDITEKQFYKPWPDYYSYENEQMRIEFFGFGGIPAGQLLQDIPKQELMEYFGVTNPNASYLVLDASYLVTLIPKKTSYRRVTVETDVLGFMYRHLEAALTTITPTPNSPEYYQMSGLSDEEKDYIIKSLSNIVEEFKEDHKFSAINKLLENKVLKLENMGLENWILEKNYVWDLELENGTLAAPSAQQTSLSDYAPFQELAPEVQTLLLDYLGETTRPEVIQSDRNSIPEQTSLLPNYPNPFNPETWIPYQLAKPADVTLTIYDINGHVVRALDLGHQAAGTYKSRARAAHWDGKNAAGESVASGVYFYKFIAGDFSATRKMSIRK